MIMGERVSFASQKKPVDFSHDVFLVRDSSKQTAASSNVLFGSRVVWLSVGMLAISASLGDKGWKEPMDTYPGPGKNEHIKHAYKCRWEDDFFLAKMVIGYVTLLPWWVTRFFRESATRRPVAVESVQRGGFWSRKIQRKARLMPRFH